MPSEFEQFVTKLHATPTRIVLAVTGGGSGAISQLLEVPGASRTVLEATVPYSAASLARWLGGEPDQACSPATARAMAMAAFHRAWAYHGEAREIAGIACTASLATDRSKRGEHRVHLALQTAAMTMAQSLVLAKGRRTRTEEESLVDRLILNLVAEACGLGERLPVGLLDQERLESASVAAPPAWQDLLLGVVDRVWQGQTDRDCDRPARAVFPGAFNPLHVGHARMAETARQVLGVPVEFEISVFNVDKPPLDYAEIQRRIGQFSGEQGVWLTRAPTFVEKSACFPGATFLVGVDTLRRIADARYYGNSPAALTAALEAIAERGCRFLVFGRQTGSGFLTLGELELPEVLRRISQEVPAHQFREDISSTEIRRGI